MFEHVTIKFRLVGVIAFLSLQLVVGGMIGILSLGSANTSIQNIYDQRLVSLGTLDQIIRLINQNELAIAKALTGEQSTLEQALAEVEKRRQHIDNIWNTYLSGSLTSEEEKLALEFTEARNKYVVEGLSPAIEALKVLDTQSGVAAVHGPMDTLFLPVREKMNALINLQLNEAKAEYAKSQEIYYWVRNSCIAGVTLGLVIAFFIGWWLVRAITLPLQGAIKIASAVASGDLTQNIEVTSNDETGRLMEALKDMNSSLVRIVGQVRLGTDAIATGSVEIANGNQDLSARTEQQASSLEETASSLEELTSTVKQNAENAQEANALAQSASKVADMGGQVISHVVSTMGSISDSSKKIANIISVIDGIAFQTNILALNAAVEAARAGEQGRGFAVVAAEVRSLAQRSSAAAKEIKELIENSVDHVDAGTKLVNEAGMTMREVMTSIQRVTNIMSEIASASSEQTAGIEQINQAVSQMDRMTQQNAALVEQAAAAAEAMRDQAEGVSQTVRMFRIDTRPTAMPVMNGAAASSPRRISTDAKDAGRTNPSSATPQILLSLSKDG